jgi:hypothetical protein
MRLKHQFTRRTRRYWRAGNLYVIRDVWQRDPHFLSGLRLMRCEYAVRNPNGSKRWKRCIEGVEFAAIEPLRTRAINP